MGVQIPLPASFQLTAFFTLAWFSALQLLSTIQNFGCLLYCLRAYLHIDGRLDAGAGSSAGVKLSEDHKSKIGNRLLRRGADRMKPKLNESRPTKENNPRFNKGSQYIYMLSMLTA